MVRQSTISTRKILRVGLFDADYPRNRSVASAFVQAGAELRDLHRPFLRIVENRLRPAQSVRALLRTAAQASRAEVSLFLAAMRAFGWADLVLFGYPGQWDATVWAPLARRFGCRIIVDPLVSLTETFVEDRRLVAPGSWRARLLRWLDRRALRAADAILADTPQQAAYWSALSGVPLDRFWVVPVGADERIFQPAVRERVGPRTEHPQVLRVLFYGTYSPLHGAETIVEAVRKLEDAGVSVTLVMIGHGQCEAAVRARAARLGLRSVTFIRWVPETDLAHWIAWADVVLGIFGSTAKAARVVPNKVYQAMAMGACVVTRDSPAMRWLLSGERAAVLVPPGDAEALATALHELRNPRQRALYGDAARVVFERRASSRVLAQQLSQVLEMLG